jgi:hypothetical protein
VEIVMVEVGEGVREMSMKKELALHLGTDQLLRDVDSFVNGIVQTSKGGRRSDSWHFVWRLGNSFTLNFLSVAFGIQTGPTTAYFEVYRGNAI